jgi:c-di-GMP-binding flagellar brake protein YcgR
LQQLEDFFSQVEDHKTVRVTLPLSDSVQNGRIHCIYGAGTPPSFLLFFPEGTLPAVVDNTNSCVVTVDLGGQAISVTADITEVKDEQTLQLKAVKVINHEQVRNYFRVDANTPVMATPVNPLKNVAEKEAWHLEGETVDLSGSGALCTFSQPLDKGKKVRINLTLPTGLMDVVHSIGHVVRCEKIEDSMYQVGFHFDMLSSEDRDKIMASCFELQRKHLRMKVQIKNPL